MITVGEYLGTRLLQLDVEHLFGLPGDFVLNLIEQLIAASHDGKQLAWLGGTNELNASYEADGYARSFKKISALVTTYGVGELSAINGIAGAYAENVPVLHIVGIPATNQLETDNFYHHMLGDGHFDHFAKAAQEVTDGGLFIDLREAATPENIPDLIDDLLLKILANSRPGYIGVPVDIATTMVSTANLRTELVVPESLDDVENYTNDLRATLSKAFEAGAENFTILAGMLSYRQNVIDDLRRIARINGAQIASQPNAKGIIPRDDVGSLGIYMGEFTDSPKTFEAVENARPLILVGTILSDLLLGQFSHKFDYPNSIELNIGDARIEDRTYSLTMSQSVPILVDVLNELSDKFNLQPVHGLDNVEPAKLEYTGKLTHDHIWDSAQKLIYAAREDVIVTADAGTSFYGALPLELRENDLFLGQIVWASIGYSIPATAGVVHALPNIRPIIFVGDGAAELTIQDLSNLYKYGNKPIVFLLNNDGYTVERLIRDPKAKYHEITSFNWKKLAEGFAGDTPIYTKTLTTAREMQKIVKKLVKLDKPAFIELMLDKTDAPQQMKNVFGFKN
ncbi:MAG: hypothetical protein LBN08_07850 [Lactobacillales bacterium]|jgi:indolepyruvate decarboxylase|nr:hypothetical protein [Lactobacillales bacterium]